MPQNPGFSPPTNDELFAQIAEKHGWGTEKAFYYARRYRLSVFPGACVFHGNTPFRVSGGGCVLCAKTARAAARSLGASSFAATCRTHGPMAQHDTYTGNCLSCREENKRAKRETPRATARREGLVQYVADCGACGIPTPHSVALGKCLTCYTSGGVRRSTQQQSARALARQKGERTYGAVCLSHGATAHHVSNGRCATCYTSGGLERRMGETLNGARAAARRLGAQSYLGHCEKHGATAFSVARGQCLTCYTAGGLERKQAGRGRPRRA